MSTFGLRDRQLLAHALFVLSTIVGACVLSACDSGGASSPTAATPGITQEGGNAGAGRGEVLFTRYCNVCHPGGGRGSGPSLIQEAPRLSDEQIRSVVRHGKNRMPGFGTTSISEDDLTALVAYVRALK